MLLPVEGAYIILAVVHHLLLGLGIADTRPGVHCSCGIKKVLVSKILVTHGLKCLYIAKIQKIPHFPHPSTVKILVSEGC